MRINHWCCYFQLRFEMSATLESRIRRDLLSMYILHGALESVHQILDTFHSLFDLMPKSRMLIAPF